MQNSGLLKSKNSDSTTNLKKINTTSQTPAIQEEIVENIQAEDTINVSEFKPIMNQAEINEEIKPFDLNDDYKGEINEEIKDMTMSW